MSIIDQIQRGAVKVAFKVLSGGGLQISPLDDTDASYEAFQQVAYKAIAEADAEGRHVQPHESSRTSRAGYDLVIIGPEQ